MLLTRRIGHPGVPPSIGGQRDPEDIPAPPDDDATTSRPTPPYNVVVEPRSNDTIAPGLGSFRPSSAHHQTLDLAWHPEKSKPTEQEPCAKDRPLTCPTMGSFPSLLAFGLMATGRSRMLTS
jgi:hypothetical protein